MAKKIRALCGTYPPHHLWYLNMPLHSAHCITHCLTQHLVGFLPNIFHFSGSLLVVITIISNSSSDYFTPSNFIFFPFNYRERNKYRGPILVVLTDKMPLDNSTLDFPLRMPIYIPNIGRRGLGNH